jgi:dihydroxy-acid dehydratase
VGGLPFEIRTAAPSDFITGAGARGAYYLTARDLIPNDIEVAVEGAQLDGMVCLASCDKTVPGQLMAAARLNIPSIVIACGYQASGEYRGKARRHRRRVRRLDARADRQAQPGGAARHEPQCD